MDLPEGKKMVDAFVAAQDKLMRHGVVEVVMHAIATHAVGVEGNLADEASRCFERAA